METEGEHPVSFPLPYVPVNRRCQRDAEGRSSRQGAEPPGGGLALVSERGHQSWGLVRDENILLVIGDDETDQGALEGAWCSRTEWALLVTDSTAK